MNLFGMLSLTILRRKSSLTAMNRETVPSTARPLFDASWKLVRKEPLYTVYEHTAHLYGDSVVLREWIPHDPAQTTITT